MPKKITQSVKEAAANDWLNDQSQAKSGVAARHGVSHRTLNRTIEMLSQSSKQTSKQSSKQSSTHTSSNVSMIGVTRIPRKDSANVTASKEEAEKEDIKFYGDDRSITLSNRGVTRVVQWDNDAYGKIIQMLKIGNLAGAWVAADIKQTIKKFSDGKLVVENDVVLYDGKPMSKCMEGTLLQILKDGAKGVKSFTKFIHRTMNTHPDVADNLWAFLKDRDIVINDDGTFSAYKGVREDYYDVHSRTIKYRIGHTVSEPRSLLCHDRNVSCGKGLHVGSLEYAKGWGSRTLRMRVKPEDVVCVPKNHEADKIRVCSYKVEAEV